MHREKSSSISVEIVSPLSFLPDRQEAHDPLTRRPHFGINVRMKHLVDEGIELLGRKVRCAAFFNCFQVWVRTSSSESLAKVDAGSFSPGVDSTGSILSGLASVFSIIVIY